MQSSVDLTEILQILIKKLWLIIMISVVGMVVAFGYTKLLVTPKYTSSIWLYVKSSETSGASVNDINAAQEMVDTYIVVVQSNKILTSVINSIQLDMTADDLKNMLTVSAVDSTQVMQIEVTSDAPQLSCNIANAFADIAPAEIVATTQAGFVSVVDTATANPTPTSPNTKLNCIIGAILGLILSVLFVIFREIFDMRVRGEEDIKKYYTIPVLGEIPNFHSQFKGGYEYYE